MECVAKVLLNEANKDRGDVMKLLDRVRSSGIEKVAYEIKIKHGATVPGVPGAQGAPGAAGAPAAPGSAPPPPPPPPPKVPPPPPVETIKFTPPKVVKDEEVIKPPPEVKQIEEAKVDVKTVEGTKDLGIVAPPTDLKGTNVVAAPVEKKEDPDKIFTKVEIEASFPGGLQAWSRYVSRAITSHIDEFSESDYGTCVVRFIVDKTGTVSDVQATTMKGTKLAEVAVNAIRNGPKWVPAQQNGRYVNAYRLQPVTLQNPDQ